MRSTATFGNWGPKIADGSALDSTDAYTWGALVLELVDSCGKVTTVMTVMADVTADEAEEEADDEVEEGAEEVAAGKTAVTATSAGLPVRA